MNRWNGGYRVLLVALGLLVSACATTVYVEQYVAKDPLPDAATLAVMPASFSKLDLATADYISGLLIGCGCQVFERPTSVKEVEQYDGSAVAAGFAFLGKYSTAATGGSRGSGTRTTSGDVVDVVKTTDANYVAFVRGVDDRLWLRLVRKDGGRVLFSGYFTPSDTAETSPQAKSRGAMGRMTQLLKTAGILR
jgi:hypothetical protein